ncbi:hypothetical protein KIPB_008477 [Kipferlia bialata]|uniref:C2H2-type domain-containing protein n=1 Tax=Kipferlia bialata TaxID=797122 RepID=A0A9K3D0R8_9EUKA|nr:hypothetical protein KIPB_008477 [Kipferlia bialata]|eukprot:g8477.t1
MVNRIYNAKSMKRQKVKAAKDFALIDTLGVGGGNIRARDRDEWAPLSHVLGSVKAAEIVPGSLSGSVTTEKIPLLPRHPVRCHFIHTEKEPSMVLSVARHLQSRSVLGLAVEWRRGSTSHAESSISCVQISTLSDVFVFHIPAGHALDVVDTSPLFSHVLGRAREGVLPLFLVDGPKAHEKRYERTFGVPFPYCQDVRPLLDRLRLGPSTQMHTAGVVVGCGTVIPKPRAVVGSDWGAWPLANAQRLFAARDAYLLVHVFHRLLPLVSRWLVKPPSKAPADAVQSVSVQSVSPKALRQAFTALDKACEAQGCEVTDKMGQRLPKQVLDTLPANVNITPYPCPVCSVRFSTRQEVLAHHLLYHPTPNAAPVRVCIPRVFLLSLPAPQAVVEAAGDGAVTYALLQLLATLRPPLAIPPGTRGKRLQSLVRQILQSGWAHPDVGAQIRRVLGGK